MAESDWREILSLSQSELVQADKEKLCESLSWMEADDIELNFTDLKSLFRLAQDILKFKSEQVNNLLGQLETYQRKGAKIKSKVKSHAESPAVSTDSNIETIARQEELIKANKEILEQLYVDIANLEERKNKLIDGQDVDKESESSRDALSEINAISQLESEIISKNRHIRKLLFDIKGLEEENTNLKEKVFLLKDKLPEATQVIENLTEQLFIINNECTQLKEILGKTEQSKVQLSIEIESLRKELFEKHSKRENKAKVYDEIKAKFQHWKNIAKLKKAEVETLLTENTKLKEELILTSKPSTPKKSPTENLKIRELQEKLSDASNEIIRSAELIERLKTENKQLKANSDEGCVSERNESDDNKERLMIKNLMKRIKTLTISLQEAEDRLAVRDKEITELSTELQTLQTDDGISKILQELKSRKRQLKFKDEGIKTLVKEINTLNEHVNELQQENESLREKLNIPRSRKIPKNAIIQKYDDMKKTVSDMSKELEKSLNCVINLELENRKMSRQIHKFIKLLHEVGCHEDKIIEIINDKDSGDVMPVDEDGETSMLISKHNTKNEIEQQNEQKEIQEIIEENEGLRKALEEMLNFLKDNSTTSSGVLALKCPSLDKILQSMEARHTAWWFASHMTTAMELRTAIGGKDALLEALHESRKETFEVMSRLAKESQISSELQQKLLELESKAEKEKCAATNISIGEFGTWMSDKEQMSIDYNKKTQIENMLTKGTTLYEDQLKNGLAYFHSKFKMLYDKMTSIAIQAIDDKNKWSLQEDEYQAQIEYLKSQLHVEDDNTDTDNSPGLLNTVDIEILQRKCSYLEESYKYIRTQNENMKNEYIECKKESMMLSSNYEIQLQKLILTLANLTDKLRSSISIEVFWKQNRDLNQISIKYREVIDDMLKKRIIFSNLFERLEEDKLEILNTIRREASNDKNLDIETQVINTEKSILHKQLQQVSKELTNKNKQIDELETKIIEFQKTQSKIIDETLCMTTKEDVTLMQEQLAKAIDENKLLKEQCQHIESQLNIALLQLQDAQQRQMTNDMEVNLLRHQVLDLQSSGDNKAIVARLSGEVLIAHLQASESYKKMERLNAALTKEKQMRVEAEDMLATREKIYEVYSHRYETKLKYIYEVMQILRQQYHGSIPLASVENYINSIEEISYKKKAVTDKLDEIEELQVNLMTKHTVYDQILDVSKTKCLNEEDGCTHKLQLIVTQGIHTRELEHYKKKLKAMDQSREEILRHCNHLEKSLVLVNQGFDKCPSDNLPDRRDSTQNGLCMQMEDIASDDDTNTRRSQTITLPKPLVLKPAKSSYDINNTHKEVAAPQVNNNVTSIPNKSTELVSVFIQTVEKQRRSKIIQTDEDPEIVKLKYHTESLSKEIEGKRIQLAEALTVVNKRTEEVLQLKQEKNSLLLALQNEKDANSEINNLNEKLRLTIDSLRKQVEDIKIIQISERDKSKEVITEESKTLLQALKQLENDKDNIVSEFKDLLNKERQEYAKNVKELQQKIAELNSQLDRKNSENNATNATALKEVVSKYTVKITELEDKCFKQQSELDGCRTDLKTYQSELDRWKGLASERLTKMEQLNSQLQERHCHEVESYKAENQHWLSQLNETQREHMDLRTRLTEQKALYLKQLAERDHHIEQLRSIVNNLKSQIMNMQTMISINDPSFDLSAIVEVDEVSDGISQQGSDRLELKYESAIDLQDHDDAVRIPASSTTIWQEPTIERLRREKQLTCKQNIILRRQIKALAARERRSRLDAQNLRNQVFRISTSGSKGVTAETSALHNKVATLQAQLTSARRDTNSTIAMWDKCKKAQQSSERWQARYEEKCQEVKKLESHLNLAKSAVARLEKEKRLLLARLADTTNDKQLTEKQDNETPEKSVRSISECAYGEPPPVSARALLDRVQAQQRRIVALEVAEKGNEFLVSEYEKSLAEITSLKGQVLKLESTLLELQIRSPLKITNDPQPELEYWKRYCDMLKEENVQLTLKINSLENPAKSHQNRISDLEHTIITLRGVVSKLQAEQKASGVKRADTRSTIGRRESDKSHNQTDSLRVEIANLKRSIQDKDSLLEKSKEMLKIAAEREDELLRENTYLRRRLDDLTKPKGGFLSA